MTVSIECRANHVADLASKIIGVYAKHLLTHV
jgi:hypothetical protein